MLIYWGIGLYLNTKKERKETIKMKRKETIKMKKLVMVGVLTLVFASGCNQVQVLDGDQEIIAVTETTSEVVEGEIIHSEEALNEEFQSEEAQGEEAQSEDMSNGEGKITEAEKESFSAWASNEDTYGFLLSTYSNIVDADLNQVFYTGAGIDSTMTEDDFDEYIAVSGASVETDVTKIYAKDIDAFLQEKTGHTLSEMNCFGFEYSEKYDCYYYQHGDTNMVSFTCLDGQWQGELLVLKFSMGYDSDTVDAITTLEKNGDGYRIVSNEFLGW